MSTIEPLPLPDNCWPIDEGCCSDWSSYDPAIQDRSAALAVQTLRMLTGYQIGGCPVTLRPCRAQCMSGYYPGISTFSPYINGDAQWLNVYCGNCVGDCSCAGLEQISLPLPVGRVDSVLVDGTALDDSAYRLDSPGWLVRLDGQAWPTCQDLTLADTEVGTMSVTYLNAEVVDGLGAYAAGVLACEFAKACSGAKCRLPSGVTEISRRGVTMSLPVGLFTEGLTGIREVDVYILAHNPYLQKMPSTVWSPDQVNQRTMLR
jgi:hypothetical protein